MYTGFIKFSNALKEKEMAVPEMNNVVITAHAVDRFLERFPRLANELRLRREDFSRYSARNCRMWEEGFKPLLKESTENRSLFNNTAFMVGYYERYGYDQRFCIVDNERIRARFVLCQNPETEVFSVVTVIGMELNRVRQNIKYNKNVQEEQAKEKKAIQVHSKEIAENKYKKIANMGFTLDGFMKRLEELVDEGTVMEVGYEQGRVTYLGFVAGREVRFTANRKGKRLVKFEEIR